MGGHAYFYSVPYEQDIDAALRRLREREFLAGRYNPVMRLIEFPIEPTSPAPGAQHRSIAQALEASGEDGTRSILDIERIAREPDYQVAARLSDAVLMELYGTAEPTAEMVAELEFLEDVDRGHAVYVIVHSEAGPSEILFAGISFD